MRKLASIQKIESIHPIAGCDQIGLAQVLGWNVIVRYDQFKAGDLCVYFEIDSLLPETETFAFMRSKSFRVRTMKMKGVVSQGLCMPLWILPEKDYTTGDDVTDLLGVKKYDPEAAEAANASSSDKQSKYTPFQRFLLRHKLTAPLGRKLCGQANTKRPFPSFVSKTDETRAETIPWVLERKDITFEAHEKIDGQSGTFFYRRDKKCFGFFHKDTFGVCSRNYWLVKKDHSSYWSVADRYTLDAALPLMLDKINDGSSWICLQGECIAPGVQQNKYQVKEPDLYCFNLITEKGGRMDSLKAAELVKPFGLKWVPLVDGAYTMPDTIEALQAFAHGQSQLAPILREGIVFRNYAEHLSLKCVDPQFLLHWKE